MYTLTKRVLPQHTDYAGVMWHGAYVQWLEERPGLRPSRLRALAMPP